MIFGSFLSNIDMQSGSPTFGTPESGIGLLCTGQIARHFGLPFRTGGGLTSSQVPDAQAGYEALMTLLPTFLAGANWVMHSAGWLEGGLVAGYEKFIVDVELLQMLQAEFTPLEIDEESLAFGAHEEVGHGGHFLGAMHTMERFRTCFYRPMLSSSENYERWMRNGGQGRRGPRDQDLPAEARGVRAAAARRRDPPGARGVRRPPPRGARRLMAPLSTSTPASPPATSSSPSTAPTGRGIVHAVTASWSSTAATSSRASSSATSDTGRFFMRIDFDDRRPRRRRRARCARTSRPSPSAFDMTFELWAARAPYRTLIMVSKQLHCLNDLLFRHEHRRAADRDPGGGLQPPRRRAAGGVATASTFRARAGHARDQAGGRGRAAASCVDELGIDLVVLARYMQVLSDDLCRTLSGPGDQHPPLVPAELQGRPALPPGLRPRGEADRRDRPLRDRRPRRGPDHRAGRHPRRPQPHPASSWSPPAATSRRRCSRARCAGTRSRGCCSNGTAPSSSASRRCA